MYIMYISHDVQILMQSVKGLNVRAKTIQSLEENIGVNLNYFRFGTRFLDVTKKHKQHRKHRLNWIKVKNFMLWKTILRNWRQSTEWEKTFTNHYLLNNFLYKWPIITWKDAWHNLSLGTTTMRYHITCTRIAGIEKSDNNKNMEKLELSYITSGNVKWHNHFGKQYRSLSNHKTWTNIRPSNSTPSYRKMQNVHRKNYILPLLLSFSTFPLLPPPSGLNTIMFSQRSLHISVSQHWIHPESLLCFQMLVLSTRLQQLEIRDYVWFILPPQW